MIMDPLERSESQGTDADSSDTMAINQSLGPALVGNISVDSLDGRPQEQQQQSSRDSTFTFGTSGALPKHEYDNSDVEKPSPAQDVAEVHEFKQEEEEEEKSQEQQQQEPQEPQQPQDPQELQQTQQHQQQLQQYKEEQYQEEQKVDEQKVEELVVGVEPKQEGEEEEEEEDKEEEKHQHQDQDQQPEPQPQPQPQQEEIQPRDESLIKLHDSINNELFHQTFKTAANLSQSSEQHSDKDDKSIMEFTKNYSDDLMGSNEQKRASSATNIESGGGADLDDFELPPYSGSSSSGSEQVAATKHSPVRQRKSSNSMATQASSYQASSDGVAAAPDLSAIKNILVSTYSKGSHVFHWKRPIETGLIFSIGLILITALTFFSIISVVAYSALGVILASGLIRAYKTSMKALNRSPETPVDHLWDKVLSVNVSMSPEKLHELVDSSHANLNASMVYFKQVLLVEDKIATTKFFIFLYSLTYIGSWFNGLTLITIIYISLFSAPILYEKNKTKIDGYLSLATNQISSSITMVTSKVGSAYGSQFGGGSKKQN